MRIPFLVFALAVAKFLVPSSLCAQELELLYTAIVADDNVEVRSGPGKRNYATHRLAQNTLVEVYREDPGGWCMIKPPEKSFSLIPAKSVKMLSDDVAEIVVNGVDAWVGTSLGLEVEPMSQLRLNVGERVVVLGEVHWEGSPIVYLQIEAPAGEFRWIQSSRLKFPPDQSAATGLSPDNTIDYSEPPAFSSDNSESKSIGFAEQSEKRDARVVNFEQPVGRQAKASVVTSNSGWRKAKRPFPRAESHSTDSAPAYSSPDRDSFSPRNSEWSSNQNYAAEQSFDVDQPIADSRFGEWSSDSIDNRSRPPRFASRDSMDRQVRSLVRNSQSTRDSSTSPKTSSSSLMAIEEALSEEMLKDPEDWDLAELKFQAERFRARSNDAVERLALQHVLDKISQCDELSRKFQRSTQAKNPPQTTGTTSEYSVQYDAVGLLKTLVNNQGRIDPVYVLQDDVGRVTHHINGIAGMNLGQYAGKKIGVFGKRGFHRGLDMQNVTAERIVVLR